MISNDQRGWILATISGLACVLGACFINLDIIVHVVPSWRSFSVRESAPFLAASLSLSFGVMFFSALFSLLPEAQHYFLQQGYPPDKAVYATVGFFLIGVLGLQVVSELLHRCLPSSIVSCENHDKDPSNPGDTNGCATEEGLSIRAFKPPGSPDIEERTPLLQSRTSLQYAASFLPTKRCANGKCYGYSDHPCDQQCKARLGKKNTEVDFNHGCPSTVRTSSVRHTSFTPDQTASHCVQNRHEHDEHPPTTEAGSGHHHVAKNKFLSIGVQTSIAIALHKFPEGFITYATNHANPALGFNVFVALFIHNIAEGFSMALPLYLALQSRTKAVIWASLLGGLAQPAGALAAWLSIRGRDFPLNTVAYGVLFSITAGIMCSVGLQLFSQAIQIHHGTRLVFVFAFLGMGIMGISSGMNAS